MPAETVLILGGTREAAELAARLAAAHPEARVVTSLAGRTRAPATLPGETRSGGFGGAEGLARWIRENGVSRLVDATHPFAQRISASAAAAAGETHVPLYPLRRPPWREKPGDRWSEVVDLEAAADALPCGAIAFLALGSQHIAAFARRTDCRFVLRMVDPPQAPLPFSAEVLLGRPAEEPAAEAGVFRTRGITHLVCRNSGGDGGYAKIEAARDLGLPVVMVGRPALDGRDDFTTVDQVLSAMAL